MTPTILTSSGTYFDFTDPDRCHFDIETIAHALANLCRFTGHTSTFYSVAQHSVLVSHMVPKPHALAGLLHDAAEAFLGDVASPLKSLLPDYRAIEMRVEAAVLGRFGLGPVLPPEVKHADLCALATEQRDLMPWHEDRWEILDAPGVTPDALNIVALQPPMARHLFMARFHELWTQASPRAAATDWSAA